MIFLKTEDEIELLRKSNLLVGKTLAEIAKVIKPGVTTKELDRVAEEFIRDNGAVPTFKGFPNQYGDPFPASICTSVNDQVVHGIPGDDVVLKDGDIVSVDCGTYMNGFCGDSAYTFCVGEVDEEVRKLLKVTKEALYIGIQNAVHGKRLGDIGYAIQQHCESNSYGVVREFVGHGIGKEMHEDPQVPNYGKRGYGRIIPDCLNQRTTYCVVIGRIVEPLFGRFDPYHIGFYLRLQIADDGMHIICKAVIHNERFSRCRVRIGSRCRHLGIRCVRFVFIGRAGAQSHRYKSGKQKIQILFHNAYNLIK